MLCIHQTMFHTEGKGKRKQYASVNDKLNVKYRVIDKEENFKDERECNNP